MNRVSITLSAIFLVIASCQGSPPMARQEQGQLGPADVFSGMINALMNLAGGGAGGGGMGDMFSGLIQQAQGLLTIPMSFLNGGMGMMGGGNGGGDMAGSGGGGGGMGDPGAIISGLTQQVMGIFNGMTGMAGMRPAATNSQPGEWETVSQIKAQPATDNQHRELTRDTMAKLRQTDPETARLEPEMASSFRQPARLQENAEDQETFREMLAHRFRDGLQNVQKAVSEVVNSVKSMQSQNSTWFSNSNGSNAFPDNVPDNWNASSHVMQELQKEMSKIWTGISREFQSHFHRAGDKSSDVSGGKPEVRVPEAPITTELVPEGTSISRVQELQENANRLLEELRVALKGLAKTGNHGNTMATNEIVNQGALQGIRSVQGRVDSKSNQVRSHFLEMRDRWNKQLSNRQLADS